MGWIACIREVAGEGAAHVCIRRSIGPPPPGHNNSPPEIATATSNPVVRMDPPVSHRKGGGRPVDRPNRSRHHKTKQKRKGGRPASSKKQPPCCAVAWPPSSTPLRVRCLVGSRDKIAPEPSAAPPRTTHLGSSRPITHTSSTTPTMGNQPKKGKPRGSRSMQRKPHDGRRRLEAPCVDLTDGGESCRGGGGA